MKVGVVGATGQVGGVMRRLLAERSFPVDEIRFFASARSAGTTLTWEGVDVRVEDAATADPSGLDIALFSAGGATSQGAGAALRRGRRHRHRQLVGLADGSGRAAHRRRGQRRRDRQRAQGHHRQPELHDDGRDAGARAAAREAGLVRLIVSTYQAVSGAGLAGVDELDKQVRQVVDRAAELTHDGSAVAFPEPVKYVRPIAFNVLPLAGSIVDDGELRDRRGEEAAQRVAQDPRHSRPARLRHLRAGAGVHRPLAVDQRRVRPAAVGGAGAGAAGRGAGRRGHRRARRRCRRPARTRATSVGSARTRASTAAAAWRCSSATTTCARAPRSTPSRSPNCWSSTARRVVTCASSGHL